MKDEDLYYSPSSTNQDFKVYRKESDEQLMDEALKKQKAEVLQAFLDANAAYAKTPIDQRFADQDAPENLKGKGEGGAEESLISPIDFITPSMVVAPAKALGKGALSLGREAIEAAPRILGNEAGELTLPQMRKVAKLMGKNPTEQQLREAAEIAVPKNIIEKETARAGEQDLLDFIAKERHGIEHSTPGEQIIEKMEKIYEPQLPKGTGVPVVINPEIIKEGVSGRLTFKNPRQNYSRIPEIVEIGNPNERVAGLFEHEKVGHEVDMLTNPFVKYQEELVPTSLDALREMTNAFAGKSPTSLETFLARVNSFKLRDKLVELLNVDQSEADKIVKNLGLNKYLQSEEAQQQGSNLLDIIKNINKGISFEDISKTGHHWRYPKNFEVQRSLDLLNPNIPVAGPDLTENLRIIKEISESNPIGLIEAYRSYKQKNFPNIAESLKGRNRFELFPVDPNTGKYIFKK